MSVIDPTGRYVGANRPDCDRPHAPVASDGGSTSYYELPPHATELNDLIEHKGM